EEVAKADRALTGTVLSSLYLLDDPVASQSFRGAFFVFPDMSVRSEGLYRIHFTVFGIRDESAFYLASCRSSNFQVYSAKRFPGMSNSTDLSRAFAEQGLKIRIRKEVR
ncbi:velvet factor, partial [Protomyces lactucae-debilis]